jgi:hypothetical protein
MRKYDLTATDRIYIGRLRDQCNQHLFANWNADPTNRFKDVKLGMNLSVPNDRELQAIIEHVRKNNGGWEDMLDLALGRHGQPGPRMKADMQPDFSELPRV